MKCHLRQRTDYGRVNPDEFDAVDDDGIVRATGRLVLDVTPGQPTATKLALSFETTEPTGLEL